jgi:hypothetical protein
VFFKVSVHSCHVHLPRRKYFPSTSLLPPLSPLSLFSLVSTRFRIRVPTFSRCTSLVASSSSINLARILVAATCSLVKLLRICVVLLALLAKVEETL